MTGQIVYFHGQPGSPAELTLIGAGALAEQAGLQAADRALQDPGPGFQGRISAEAAALAAQARPVQLIGFSLGAFVAMEVALRLAELAPSLPVRLDLISPAGPLALGDFLPGMAGGPLFRLARDAPAAFAAVTRLQGVGAGLVPGWLVGLLFTGAAGPEAALTAMPAFRRGAAQMVRGALGPGATIYRQDILAYVAQDPARLSRLDRPVRIWQGREDTWTPPAMADALARTLPDVRSLTYLDGLSHYSTLQRALPRILGPDPGPS
jgi:pimeloyl-ACP methyl ester carboxylesterase